MESFFEYASIILLLVAIVIWFGRVIFLRYKSRDKKKIPELNLDIISKYMNDSLNSKKVNSIILENFETVVSQGFSNAMDNINFKEIICGDRAE